MSIKALNWAYGSTESKGSEKFTLVTLADHADEDGFCFPSRRHLSVRTGMSPSQITRHLTALEDKGLIEREARARRNGSQASNGYRLTMREGGPQDAEGGAHFAQGAISVDAEGGSAPMRTLEPSVEPPLEEPDSSSAREVDGLPVSDDEFKIASTVLEAFNEANGSSWTPLTSRGALSPALGTIIARVRESPELTVERHREVIARNFKARWWGPKQAGTVGVIYGRKAWGRALACDGVADSGRRVRRFKGERQTPEAAAPW